MGWVVNSDSLNPELERHCGGVKLVNLLLVENLGIEFALLDLGDDRDHCW